MLAAARSGRSGAARVIRACPQQLQGVMWMSDDKDKTGQAGAITGAGGKFAERESALENEYFYKLQKEQIAKLKSTFHEEIKHHEEEIKRHQEAIKRYKDKANEIEKAVK